MDLGSVLHILGLQIDDAALQLHALLEVVDQKLTQTDNLWRLLRSAKSLSQTKARHATHHHSTQ